MTYQEKQERINKIKRLIGEYQLKKEYWKVDHLRPLLKRVKKMKIECF